MRVAAVQTSATRDREENLASAGELVAKAAAQGAELIVVPEHFSVYGNASVLRESAQTKRATVMRWASDTAREHSVWLVAGSYVELSGARRYNTTSLVGPDGSIVGAYRKIHLFDVDVPGATTRESDAVSPGTRGVVVSMTPADVRPVPVGLTICYDLRFPELYRLLTLAGALVIVVPSAFSAVTGASHWEPLVKARAIENQVFLIAAGQVGTIGGSYEAYGHSMIVDPWGRTLAEVPVGTDIAVADLDFTAQQDIRSNLPSLTAIRPTSYRRSPQLLAPGRSDGAAIEQIHGPS